jgi:hypothetical protein
VITPGPKRPREETASDVGTLWTMRRSGRRARCALMACAGEWELRVLEDGEAVFTERCPRGDEVFVIAELWKRRMFEQGWDQVVPGSPRRTPGDRRPSRFPRLRPR